MVMMMGPAQGAGAATPRWPPDQPSIEDLCPADDRACGALLVCQHCRRFARQMQRIGLASQGCRDGLEPEGADGDFEARMLKKLIDE